MAPITDTFWREGKIRSAVFTYILLALTVGALAGCGKSKNTDFYHGEINIPKAAGLSQQEREVEERFAEYVGQNPEKAVEAYRKQFGKKVNVDNARELSKDYAPHGPDVNDDTNREHRTMYSDAVQEPSRALAKAVYLQMLKEPASNDPPVVVFTAGGAASGKTTSIAKNGAIQSILNSAQIVYDTTMSESKTSLEKIDQALNSGKSVCIVFVYRDPVESFLSALQRAMDEGRTLSLGAFVETHESAPEVLLRIADQYKDDKRVEINVIDNSRGEGKAVEKNLAFIGKMAGLYKPDELKQRLRSELDAARANNRISEAVYLAFKGK
ncbi:MAG TPA: zeta toxin family protein [Terriglobia bacterium]|nr:zeta toxin family protein [Terriglobia bacterium]